MSQSRPYPMMEEVAQARRNCIERGLLERCRELQQRFALADTELASALEALADWFSLSEDAGHWDRVDLDDEFPSVMIREDQ